MTGLAGGGAGGLAGVELRMINDIARQFRHRPAEEAAAEIAGHVRRFWDPRMRTRLLDLVDSGADSLDPLAVAAARLIVASRES